MLETMSVLTSSMSRPNMLSNTITCSHGY
jgi:hypothetical protein